MYFDKIVRQACEEKPGCLVLYRTKTGFEGGGLIDGFGDDGMRLQVRGFTGAVSHKFVRFESIEEILFDEGTREASAKDIL